MNRPSEDALIGHLPLRRELIRFTVPLAISRILSAEKLPSVSEKTINQYLFDSIGQIRVCTKVNSFSIQATEFNGDLYICSQLHTKIIGKVLESNEIIGS